MGSYRIEASPNKRAGCSVKACKDKGVKIQKGEIRLGTWIEAERFQSWSWRHWGCLTSKVIQNIKSSIGENGEPDFDLIDGFENLPEEMQAKVRTAIETGEIDDADKTDHGDGANGEDASEATEKPTVKVKADSKAKTKKRSRAESEDEEEAPAKKTKKAKGRAAANKEEEKEEAPEQKPSKRTRSRKAEEEPDRETEKPSKKTKKKTVAADTNGDAEEAEVKPRAKRGRGKEITTNGGKPKRGRPKRVVDED